MPDPIPTPPGGFPQPPRAIPWAPVPTNVQVTKVAEDEFALTFDQAGARLLSFWKRPDLKNLADILYSNLGLGAPKLVVADTSDLKRFGPMVNGN